MKLSNLSISSQYSRLIKNVKKIVLVWNVIDRAKTKKIIIVSAQQTQYIDSMLV